MPRPYWTAALPVGSVIEHDGMTVKKTHDSDREPFPWTSENGTEYDDEWAANAVADGGVLTEPEPTTNPSI
ncbi:hypothetical protein BDK92_7199 [Micromonospora pisi]|uniref:Uncharacterized protein n=1 Tax=Micromonospora pisi TaxID=589240 RepID=A0A495JV61_9ACTN|nr:hypothetical protein [Micromonospora pisi]RKR92721.1 hypothetical protein BDK92_7199 [Micromonospora pisi]